MDIELLISSVYKRPAIWDRGKRDYSDKLQVYTCWSEISRELQIDESLLKKKWKYLRDQFAVELGKFPMSFSSPGPADGAASKWQYFKQLHFLRNVVKPRLSLSLPTGNPIPTNDPFITNVYSTDHAIKTEPDTNDGIEIEIDTAEGSDEQYHQPTETVLRDEEEASPPTLNQTVITTPCTSHHNNIKRSNDDFESSEVPVKIRRITKSSSGKSKSNHSMGNPDHSDMTNFENQDDDLMFMKSLLPYIRQIPRHRRLQFRSKMLALVDGYINSSPPSSSSHHHDHQQQQQTCSPNEQCTVTYNNYNYNSGDSGSETCVVEPKTENDPEDNDSVGSHH